MVVKMQVAEKHCQQTRRFVQHTLLEHVLQNFCAKLIRGVLLRAGGLEKFSKIYSSDRILLLYFTLATFYFDN